MKLLKIIDGNKIEYSVARLKSDYPNISFPSDLQNADLSGLGIYTFVQDEIPAYSARTQKVIMGSFYQRPDITWARSWDIVEKPAEEIEEYDNELRAGIKQEARRRILDIAPEWKQQNLTARGVELLGKGRENWTSEEQSEWAAGDAIWNSIKAIRVKSNELEMSLPEDYTDDSHWI